MPKDLNNADDEFSVKSMYTSDNGVLVNKLGIFDEEALNAAERVITSYKLAKLYLNPGVQTFDSKHYQAIHKYLFESIYPFAGEFRNENIAKRITFCLYPYIGHNLEDTLKKAMRQVSKVDSRDKLLFFITELYSDLDIIHPFREGNGRTEREYMRQFIDYICKKNNLEPYYLNYDLIEDKDKYIDAVVKADISLDYGDLMALFDQILMVKEPEMDKKLKD